MLGRASEKESKLTYQNFEDFGLELLVDKKQQHVGGSEMHWFVEKTILYLWRFHLTQCIEPFSRYHQNARTGR
jgi:hypothetical protein